MKASFSSLPLLLSLGLLLGLQGCASNPTGGTNFVLMSENSEISLGEEMHQSIIDNTPIYNDPAMQAYVDEIGQRLVTSSHRSDLEFHFTIIDSPDINAFAAPGGYVYINRGLMTYLTTEAQLAAVLGHEIGHITGRHAVRRDAASKTSNILSTVLVAATGVSDLGETSQLLGGALISGYGRDMELEADGLGAEYLFNAGYDPQAMVEVITVLKNHEDFTKLTSNNNTPAYHGLFSTHPRNDTRLYQAVNNAGDLNEQTRLKYDPAMFRQAMTGLPVGPTVQSTVNAQDRNRYYQSLLNYTMIFPDEWAQEETATTVSSTDSEHTTLLLIEAQRRTQNIDPRTFISDTLGITGLQQTEELRQYGLPGYTGIFPGTNNRLAVIYYGPRAFIFRSELSDGSPENADDLIQAAISSFRPIARNEQSIANPVAIRYIQANGQTTYADLARSSRISQYPEEKLRLMNGDYPSGEPMAGEWIKVAD